MCHLAAWSLLSNTLPCSFNPSPCCSLQVIVGVNKYAQHDAEGEGPQHDVDARKIDNTAVLHNQKERLKVGNVETLRGAGVGSRKCRGGACDAVVQAAPSMLPARLLSAAQRVRASRDGAAVQAALAALEAEAHSGKREHNLLQLAVEAARLRCVMRSAASADACCVPQFCRRTHATLARHACTIVSAEPLWARSRMHWRRLGAATKQEVCEGGG